jgi:lysophospholipase L1-like esterase
MHRTSQGLALKRIAKILLISIAIVASLLAFPSDLPWLVGAWLAFSTITALRGGAAWKPLAVCCVIVVVKRPDWSPSLAPLTLLMAVVASSGVAVNLKRDSTKRLMAWCSIAILWTAWGLFAANYAAATRTDRKLQFNSRPVVCIGDSLTAYGYPKELAKRLSVAVIDLSINGCTSADALGLISRMQAARPQTVVIELGGHDYLHGASRVETASNLRRMIEAARSADADVVLMEIPRGACIDPFRGLERSLARQYDLELIPDTPIRNLILWSPYVPPGVWSDASRRLSDDGLHPNERGNVFLANWVAAALSRMYGTSIQKP